MSVPKAESLFAFNELCEYIDADNSVTGAWLQAVDGMIKALDLCGLR